MGIDGAVILAGVITALAVVVWGACNSRRSIAVAAVAAVVALLAAGCGWYAFAESQSIPWTIGYGLAALASVGVALKQVLRSPRHVM